MVVVLLVAIFVICSVLQVVKVGVMTPIACLCALVIVTTLVRILVIVVAAVLEL